MASKKGLPVEQPNRKGSHIGSKVSRVDKRSRNDGTIPIGQDLAPDQGRRVSKEPIFGPSAPMGSGKVRDDSFLGRFDSTRKSDAAGPRNFITRGQGADEVERVGDNITTFNQGQPPSDLDIP